jgi:hypothetical protein
MGKVQNPSNSVCYTPSSEPFRICLMQFQLPHVYYISGFFHSHLFNTTRWIVDLWNLSMCNNSRLMLLPLSRGQMFFLSRCTQTSSFFPCDKKQSLHSHKTAGKNMVLYILRSRFLNNVFSYAHTGIVGSNPTGDMDVCVPPRACVILCR